VNAHSIILALGLVPVTWPSEHQHIAVSFFGDTLTLSNGEFVIISSISQANYRVQFRLNEGVTPCELYEDGIPLDSLSGKLYQGGIIFHLDDITCKETVAATSEQSTGAPWGCSGDGGVQGARSTTDD